MSWEKERIELFEGLRQLKNENISFQDFAMAVFKYQVGYNIVYKQYVQNLGIDKSNAIENRREFEATFTKALNEKGRSFCFEYEPQTELLAQCGDGILLQPAQGRAHLPESLPYGR